MKFLIRLVKHSKKIIDCFFLSGRRILKEKKSVSVQMFLAEHFVFFYDKGT